MTMQQEGSVQPASKPIRRRMKERATAVDEWFAPAANTIKHSNIGQILALVATAYTLYSVYETTVDLQADVQVRREESIERAWNKLLLPMGGNIGKGDALDKLVSENVDLTGIDLSCKERGTWDSQLKACINRPIYASFTLPHQRVVADDPSSLFAQAMQSMLDLTSLPVTSMQETIISGMRAERMYIPAPVFNNASISRSMLSGTLFWRESKGLSIRRSDLSYAWVAQDIVVGQSNISGTTFSAGPGETGSTTFSFAGGNWAWADMPPRVKDASDSRPAPAAWLLNMRLCAHELRAGNETAVWKDGDYTRMETATGILPQARTEKGSEPPPPLTTSHDGIQIPDLSTKDCRAVPPELAAEIFPDRYPPAAEIAAARKQQTKQVIIDTLRWAE